MHIRRAVSIIMIALLFCACAEESAEASRQAAIAALLKSNEIQRQAHMTGDAELLAEEIADSMITVANGNITTDSNAAIRARFASYFQQVTYTLWDDVQPPKITLSSDLTLATVMVKKIVVAARQVSADSSVETATLFSWTANYRKEEGRWRIYGNTSTRENLAHSSALPFYRKGRAAMENGDFTAAAHHLQRAHYLKFNNLTVMEARARALTLAGNHSAAITLLNRLAEIRFINLFDLAVDPVFRQLADTPGYGALLAKIDTAQKPVSRSDTMFTIAERDLIPEGIAFDPQSDRFFVSSTYKRKILSIDSAGEISEFASSAQDGLWGTVGMMADARRRHLWVASCNAHSVMPMAVPEPDSEWQSRIYKYDIDSGRLLRRYDLAAPAQQYFLNDITIAANGDVYLTESNQSAIYKIDHKTDRLMRLRDTGGEMVFPNGLALSADETRLYITHAEGIAILHLADTTLSPLRIPPTITLENIDGLEFYDGTLIAHQSGYPINSIMQYHLSTDGLSLNHATILESHHPAFDQAATGVVAGDRYVYLANCQLRSAIDWEQLRARPLDQLHDIIILSAPLSR